jgi:phosphoglycerate dehydrogenase-like enzyme
MSRRRGLTPPKILVYHARADAYRALLAERFPDLEVAAGAGADVLDRHLADAEVLLAFRFPVERLAEARRLRWVQLTSAGADHLVEGCPALAGVTVTNTRGIHVEVMADYTLGVMVMLQWRFPRLLRQQQARVWRQQSTEPLAGKRLGVVGVGAIGGEIARRGAAIGMEVLGVRRDPTPVAGVSRMFGPDGLRELLPLCDFVVLAVPGTPATRHLVGEAELRRMRPGAFLVNIARGNVVDEPALVRALQDGAIAGAALDVFETEPLPPASPLWAMENVIVTPHISGEPDDYPRRVMTVFEENIRRWREGRPLTNVVHLDRGY